MQSTNKFHVNLAFVVLAVACIGATGLVHLIEAPENYSEMAYKGILFYLNAVAALVAAIGIVRQQRWGWWLGILVAVGSIILYAVSRTIGLPGLPATDESWFELTGVISLLVESGFLLVAGGALFSSGETSNDINQTPSKASS